jgi:galactonate dehydratase
LAPYPGLYSPHVETLFVQVRTDTELSGWGEAQAPIGPEVTAAIAERLLASVVVGRDPLDSGVLWHEMYRALTSRGHTTSFALDAIAAVDIALWDIAGKAWGVPAHKLLGGAHRRMLPTYVSLGGSGPEAYAAAAVEQIEAGLPAVKLFLGKGIDSDLATVEAVRRAIGDKGLMVDTQWMYSVPEAIQLGRALERQGVRWLETPTKPEDVAGNAEIARALDMAIALGECERTRWQFRPILEARAADVIQPDVGRVGGISETMRIAALAETYNVPVALHQGVGFGPYIAATLQVAAAIPELAAVEYQPHMQRLFTRLTGERIAVRDGALVLPDEPGLGVAFRDDAIVALAG